MSEKKSLSPEERKEKRAALLQLLLIILVGVAIVYLGIEIGIGVLSIGYFFIRVIFGGSA